MMDHPLHSPPQVRSTGSLCRNNSRWKWQWNFNRESPSPMPRSENKMSCRHARSSGCFFPPPQEGRKVGANNKRWGRGRGGEENPNQQNRVEGKRVQAAAQGALHALLAAAWVSVIFFSIVSDTGSLILISVVKKYLSRYKNKPAANYKLSGLKSTSICVGEDKRTA